MGRGMKPLNEYDKQGILSEEVFIEIFGQEDAIRQAQLLLSCQDRAKELGVKGKFDALTKAYSKVDKETRRKESSRAMLENWTNFSGGYNRMKCGAWIAADDGIRIYNKDYSNDVICCYHPILPVGRLRNLETGEEQIRLAYKRNHQWTEITVPKDVISSANRIVSLSKLGVSVTSENAKLLVKYLSDVENLNDDNIPVRKSSSKLGWIGGGFLPYDTEVIFDGDSSFRQVYESIRERGSRDVWLDHVRELRGTGRPEIKFSLAASFASPLIHQIGALPFIMDLWGETEGGKTVSLMLAASVWANPDTGQYIGDLKTTDTQLEIRADLLNHMPLLLDDTSKTSARIRDNFEGVVYDLCSGKGKSRSNKDLGIRRESRWRNTILTNGERPLSSYVTQGGAINRILEVECKENVYADPQKTAELVKKNYGFAGHDFVGVIKGMDPAQLREMYQDIQREIYCRDKMQKQSMAMSALLLADRIATDYIFRDGAYITLAEAESVLADKGEVSEHERCYHYLVDKIAMNRSRFGSNDATEQWGMIDGGWAYMFPQAVKELCQKGNYSYKAFMSWADRQGVIQTDGRNQTKPKRIRGELKRCVCLQLDAFKDENGFEPLVEEDKIPFK